MGDAQQQVATILHGTQAEPAVAVAAEFRQQQQQQLERRAVLTWQQQRQQQREQKTTLGPPKVPDVLKPTPQPQERLVALRQKRLIPS